MGEPILFLVCILSQRLSERKETHPGREYAIMLSISHFGKAFISIRKCRKYLFTERNFCTYLKWNFILQGSTDQKVSVTLREYYVKVHAIQYLKEQVDKLIKISSIL